METWMMIAIGAAGVAAIGVVVGGLLWADRRKRGKQTSTLREGFGPEYARTVGEQGRSDAEKDLIARQERSNLFPVRSLTAIEVTHYTDRWASAQAQFVVDPGAAMSATGHLVAEVIAARGYPGAEFEQGASALSVDHPRVVQDYRAAHAVELRHQRNPVATDELRAAMGQYHHVFTELTQGATLSAPVVSVA
ncbi:MAG: hypothetical protein ACKVVT_03635 [Dehalococcoidia bacterium]